MQAHFAFVLEKSQVVHICLAKIHTYQMPKVTPSHFPLKLFSVLFEKGWVKCLIILFFLSLGIGMLWHFLDGMLPMHSTLHNQKHGVCLCLF